MAALDVPAPSSRQRARGALTRRSSIAALLLALGLPVAAQGALDDHLRRYDDRSDKAGACDFLRRAAPAIPLLARHKHRLGLCHLQGTGVLRDRTLGEEWLSKAAAEGHEPSRQALAKLDAPEPAPAPTGDPKAAAEARMTGDRHRLGRGVPASAEQALHWYRTAERLGDVSFALAQLIARVEPAARRETLDRTSPLPFPRVASARPYAWGPDVLGSFWHAYDANRREVGFDGSGAALMARSFDTARTHAHEVQLKCAGRGFDGLQLIITLDPKAGLRFLREVGYLEGSYKLWAKGTKAQPARVSQSGRMAAFSYERGANAVRLVVLHEGQFTAYQAANGVAGNIAAALGVHESASRDRAAAAAEGYSDELPLAELLRSDRLDLRLPVIGRDDVKVELDTEMINVYAHWCTGSASWLDVREAAIRQHIEFAQFLDEAARDVRDLQRAKKNAKPLQPARN